MKTSKKSYFVTPTISVDETMFDDTATSPFGDPSFGEVADKDAALQDLLLSRQYQSINKTKENVTWPRIDSGTHERDAQVLDICYTLIGIYPPAGD